MEYFIGKREGGFNMTEYLAEGAGKCGFGNNWAFILFLILILLILSCGFIFLGGGCGF